VVGTGWPPQTTVFVRYAGQPSASAVVNSQGDFHAHVVANSLVPGERKVVVHDGKYAATAIFTQTL
jgi:hypothetical protein